jgi:uncharacterized membrane protein YdbT with pleckstrin-like domain
MFCLSCGKPLPPGSRYCNLCGAEQPSKTSTSDPRGPIASDRENQIFELRPTMLFIIAGYVLAALVAIGAAALIAVFSKPFWLVLIVAVILLAIPGWFHIRRESEVYRLTDHKIEIRRGMFSRTVRNIPLSSIQDVTSNASLGERLLGIGSLEIDSAAVEGKIYLRNIPSPAKYTDAILDRVRLRN